MLHLISSPTNYVSLKAITVETGKWRKQMELAPATHSGRYNKLWSELPPQSSHGKWRERSGEQWGVTGCYTWLLWEPKEIKCNQWSESTNSAWQTAQVCLNDDVMQWTWAAIVATWNIHAPPTHSLFFCFVFLLSELRFCLRCQLAISM